MKRLVAFLLTVVMVVPLLVTGFTVRASAAGATPDDYTYEEYLAMTTAEKAEFKKLFSSTLAYIQWVNAAREAYEAANPKDEIGDDGVIDLSGNAAQVGDTKYADISAAITAAEGKTLVLLKNAGNIAVSGSIAIDLNGHTLGTVTLTAMTAAVTCQSQLTVETTVTDAKVVKNGSTWSVESKVYVAKVNGTDYETLTEAVASAGNGDTITLLADTSADTLTLPAGATLDLAGKTLTAAALSADTAQVKDSDQSGLLKIAAAAAAFHPANGELPIYDTAAGGFRLAKVAVKTLTPQWAADGVVYTFRFDLENSAWEQLILNNIAVEAGIRIQWGAGYEDFKMTAEQIGKIVSVHSGGFIVTVTGMSGLTDISVSTWLHSAGTTVIDGLHSK